MIPLGGGEVEDSDQAPRLSRVGQTPYGGTRPKLAPEPLPNPDDDSFVIPDDARELAGDRELTLV